MDEFRNVIKKKRAESEVLSFQPRRIELDLSDSAKVYLNEQNRKKSDFVISDLIAKQTGVAHVESEAHKALVEKEVLEKLKEVQEKAYEEAFQLGKEEGSNAAFQAVKADLDQKFADFSSTLEELKSLRSRILKTHEKELIELVFQIGKKIALKELSEDSTSVKSLLETIMLECEQHDQIKIYLSPTDKQFISSQIEAGALTVEELAKIKLVEDSEMTNGGCRVQTEYGSIDSQVEQRVENAWNALKSRMPHGDGSDS